MPKKYRNPNAKLNWDIVADIRKNAIINGGTLSYTKMAEMYDVDKMVISRIVNNKSWIKEGYVNPEQKIRKTSPRHQILECVIW